VRKYHATKAKATNIEEMEIAENKLIWPKRVAWILCNVFLEME
jgi:hypothetical protein